MSKQQKGLGRGLGALIPDMEEADRSPLKVRLQKLEPNPDQPRKDFAEEELFALADSIREHGLIQPIAVRELGDGSYRIISGERRWRAARLAGLEELPVYVLDVDDRGAAELALVENLQREDLNPIEEANGYRSLMEEYGLTQEQTAQRVGKSRPAIANALRLLALPEELQKLLQEGTLSAGHCRALLTLPGKEQQLRAVQKITALNLSVRQTETLCKNLLKEKSQKPAPAKTFTVDYIAACEKDMARALGRKVKITNGKRKGKFEIEFYGSDDLQVLLEQLQAIGKR